MIDLVSIRRAAVTAILVAGVAGYAAPPASAVVRNEAICTAPDAQMPPSAVSNGAGGALIAWADLRWGDHDIYLQQTNGVGQPMWTVDGIPVCKVGGSQQYPQVTADGTGAVIVAWQDSRGPELDIWAQRVSSTGVVVWTVGGIPICSAAGVQERPQVIADGAGGAVIVWVDHRSGTPDVYAQRVDASGNALWSENGVPVCVASGAQTELSAISDGWGGVIVAWKDARGGGADVYAQRMNATGLPVWTLDGVVVSAAPDVQQTPAIVTDGAFGAIVAWVDRRSGDSDVYAQRLGAAAGAPQWTVDGVVVTAATGDQQAPKLVPDGASGAIVAWEDRRGANADIYAQRMTSVGGASWTANGVAICSAAADQTGPAISTDETGGAVIAWADLRTGASGSDIYAQRLNGAGTAAWTANGVALCDTLQSQYGAATVSDGGGGAIATWCDMRAVTQTDVFAQRVDAGGLVLGQCPPAAATLATNTLTTVSSLFHYYDVPVASVVGWSGVGVRSTTADWDVEFYPSLTYGLAPYPICFGSPMAASNGSGVVDFVAISFESNRTPVNTTYGTRATRYSGAGNGTLEWDLRQESLSNTGTATNVNNWSGVLNVYDVRLVAGNTYSIELTASHPGIKLLFYTSNGLPGPFVASRENAVFETTTRRFYTASVTEWYGVVVVNDTGATGSYTVRVTPVTTGVGDAPMAEAGLMGISPNPARGKATFHFALTQAGEVSFRVLDMAGRVVASMPAQRWEAGAWSLPWDGAASDGRALAAGVYFVQMELDGRKLGQQRVALVR